MTRRLALGAALALGLCSGFRAPCAAQGTDEARAAFEHGVELTRQARWEEAVAAFERSLTLAPRTVTRFNLAVAHYRAGHMRDAVVAIDALLRQPDLQPEVRADVEPLREVALGQLARLRLRVLPAHALLLVDGAPHGDSGPVRQLLLDPGPAELRLTAPAHLEQRLLLTLEPGAVLEREVTLRPVSSAPLPQAAGVAITAPAPAPVPPTQAAQDSRRGFWRSPWFWGAVGVVVAAGVTTALAVGLTPAETPSMLNGGSSGIVFD